jgi:hypothetical protein
MTAYERTAFSNRAPSAAVSLRSTTEAGTDRYGLDYSHSNGGSAESCRAACLQDAKCKAWTWVEPGVKIVDGNNGSHCWLKSAVPPPTRYACCISGMIEGRGNALASQNSPTGGNNQAACVQAVKDIAAHGCGFQELAGDIGLNGANCGSQALFVIPNAAQTTYIPKGNNCIFNGCFSIDKACTAMIRKCQDRNAFPCT